MSNLPRNEVPCQDRQCGVNCLHCCSGMCVVPKNEEIVAINLGKPCIHTDETYETGMVSLESDSKRQQKAGLDALIRQKYSIPKDVGISAIDRQNFRSESMAYIHAIMNSHPSPTHCSI